MLIAAKGVYRTAPFSIKAPSMPPVARRLPSEGSQVTLFKLFESMALPSLRALGDILETGSSVSTVMSQSSSQPAPSTSEKTPGLMGDHFAS
ncbi:hypothetical protein HYQ46_011215 [Verticillium longisporum]|nr:hypothetical protein HYQ46_011215 [Verticillium longisporum]